ncbi:MAG: hypothetical protein IKX35_08405 [Bacteroidales bacterium]|nr:hypothetical protein [Bacteroidales bacterium]
MITLEQFHLKGNPFRVTPAVTPEEIIWAGFSDVKGKMENRIKRAIQMPNSSLVLNWGEYGSGKTHAALYFQKADVLESLLPGKPSPFTCMLGFPKGKEPVKEIYTQIIDKLNIDSIRRKADALDKEAALQRCTDSELIKNVLRLLFDDTASATNIKSYLYGNASITSTYINENIQRKLDSDIDYIDFLSALFSFITFNKIAYSCVVLWIDEFEDIAMLSSANINKMNGFIRTLLDKTPNNLLVFMNLTQSAMMDVDDLSDYLQESVKSRIKEKIELPIPDAYKVKEYLSDLLNNPIYRIGDAIGFIPFDESVVDQVIADLGESVSLRKYNEVFSALLENGLYDDQETIDRNYYERIKNEIIG